MTGWRGTSCRPAQPQGLVWGNALADHCSRNFTDQVARRIIDIQRERTAVGVALIAKDKRFGQITRSLKISAYIVEPDSVSQLKSPRRRLLPRAKAYASGSWIDIRIVNFGAASIPDLKCFLDGLISNQETDMPESNDGRVDRIFTCSARPVLDR